MWFVKLTGERVICEEKSSRSLRQRVIELIAQQLGVKPSQVTEKTLFVEDLGAYSLDTVELVMELEEELEGR